MRSDIQDTSEFREAEQIYRDLRRPGGAHVSDAAEIHASPRGSHAAAADLAAADVTA